jgi:hypothetical protein
MGAWVSSAHFLFIGVILLNITDVAKRHKD